MRVLPALALLLVTLPGTPLAESAASVAVVDVDPRGSASLASHHRLYARLSYRSAEPVRLVAHGFASGERVVDGARMSPGVVYPAGAGEAIAWVSYAGPLAIDELRVDATNATGVVLATASEPVDARWSPGAPASSRAAAPWVGPLDAAQQAMATSATGSRGETGFGDHLLFALLGLSIPGYFVLQVYLVMRSRGRWKTLAKLPLLFMAPIVAYTIFAFAASSNLWPLLLLFSTPVAFAYLLVLSLSRWLATREPASQ